MLVAALLFLSAAMPPKSEAPQFGSDAEQAPLEGPGMAEKLQKIFDDVDKKRVDDEAAKQAQDSIARKKAAEKELKPVLPVIPEPIDDPRANRNSAGVFRPDMGAALTIAGASEGPDFWQRNSWAWPLIQWLTFIGLIVAAVIAARWPKKRKLADSGDAEKSSQLES